MPPIVLQLIALLPDIASTFVTIAGALKDAFGDDEVKDLTPEQLAELQIVVKSLQLQNDALANQLQDLLRGIGIPGDNP